MAARIAWGRLADAGGGRRRVATLRDVGILACAAAVLTWLVWPEGTAVRIVALVLLSFGALGFNGVLYLIAGEIAGAARAGQAVALMSTALFGGGALAAVPAGCAGRRRGLSQPLARRGRRVGRSACSRVPPRARPARGEPADSRRLQGPAPGHPRLCCLRGCAVSGRTGARAHRRLARSGWAWRRAPRWRRRLRRPRAARRPRHGADPARQAPPRRGDRRTSGCRAAPTASRRRARTSAPAAAAAGRTCATSGSSSTSSSRCSTRCSASPGCPSRRVEPIVPAVREYAYRNKLEYAWTSTPEGVALGFHRAGRWEEIVPLEVCLLTGDARQRRARGVRRLGARAGARGLRPARPHRLSAPPRRARGRAHRRAALHPRHRAPGDVPGVEELRGAAGRARAGRRRRAARRQRRRRRGRERHPHAPALRPRLVRGGDQRPAPARLGRLLPADQHRDGRRALPRRDRAGRADRRRDRVGPVLRHRLDRARAGGRRAPRDRHRDRRRGDRARARERARQRRRERAVRVHATPARRRAT